MKLVSMTQEGNDLKGNKPISVWKGIIMMGNVKLIKRFS